MSNLKRIIEQAIDCCKGSDMNSTRNLLLKALKEAKQAEQKIASKKVDTLPQWKFDINTSSLQNLNKNQLKNVLNKIQNMIEDENKKNQKTQSTKNDVIFE